MYIYEYGLSILGRRAYSCINLVQKAAMRFFLGVGKYMGLYGKLRFPSDLAISLRYPFFLCTSLAYQYISY